MHKLRKQLSCKNTRFKLDWLLGLGCVEEWRFPDTYQTLQLPSSGWRNLESKRTTVATHSKRWNTALSWTNTKQGLAPAFPLYSTATYPPPLNSSLICPTKTTHRSSDDKRNHLHLSTLHPPSRICQIPKCFQSRFYTIPPSASNPLFMCFPKPCLSFPPKNQLNCLFTTTGKIPLWVRNAVMCSEQSECPSHTSLTARTVTGLWLTLEFTHPTDDLTVMFAETQGNIHFFT